MKYLTIRADIKESSINLKYHLLHKLIDKVNEHIKKDDALTLINLQIRDGDELFGVYSNAEYFMDVFTTLITEAKAFEIPLYIGVGYGGLDIVTSDPMIVNGDSIWQATNALNHVKKNSKRYDIQVNRLLSFNFLCETNKTSSLLSNLFLIYLQTIHSRTSQQDHAVYIYEISKDVMSKADMYQLISNKDNSPYNEKEGIKNTRLFDKFLDRANYNFQNDLKENIIYLLDEVISK